jgi:hypothetical protein
LCEDVLEKSRPGARKGAIEKNLLVHCGKVFVSVKFDFLVSNGA